MAQNHTIIDSKEPSSSSSSTSSASPALSEDREKEEFNFKVVVLGEPNSGKSTFLESWINNNFTSNYFPTSLVQRHTKKMKAGHAVFLTLSLLDFPGASYSYPNQPVLPQEPVSTLPLPMPTVSPEILSTTASLTLAPPSAQSSANSKGTQSNSNDKKASSAPSSSSEKKDSPGPTEKHAKSTPSSIGDEVEVTKREIDNSDFDMSIDNEEEDTPNAAQKRNNGDKKQAATPDSGMRKEKERITMTSETSLATSATSSAITTLITPPPLPLASIEPPECTPQKPTSPALVVPQDGPFQKARNDQFLSFYYRNTNLAVICIPVDKINNAHETIKKWMEITNSQSPQCLFLVLITKADTLTDGAKDKITTQMSTFKNSFKIEDCLLYSSKNQDNNQMVENKLKEIIKDKMIHHQTVVTSNIQDFGHLFSSLQNVNKSSLRQNNGERVNQLLQLVTLSTSNAPDATQITQIMSLSGDGIDIKDLMIEYLKSSYYKGESDFQGAQLKTYKEKQKNFFEYIASSTTTMDNGLNDNAKKYWLTLRDFFSYQRSSVFKKTPNTSQKKLKKFSDENIDPNVTRISLSSLSKKNQ
jgi:GTPase SAR1 family protein